MIYVSSALSPFESWHELYNLRYDKRTILSVKHLPAVACPPRILVIVESLSNQRGHLCELEYVPYKLPRLCFVREDFPHKGSVSLLAKIAK